jgi:hypothetical protein
MSIQMITAIATLQLTGVILFELFVYNRRQAALVPRTAANVTVLPGRVESAADLREAA